MQGVFSNGVLNFSMHPVSRGKASARQLPLGNEMAERLGSLLQHSQSSTFTQAFKPETVRLG